MKASGHQARLQRRGQRRGRGTNMTTRAATRTNRKKIIFTPKEVMDHLMRLRRHKAPGIQVDSLDLFIKLARRRNNEKRKKEHRQPNQGCESFGEICEGLILFCWLFAAPPRPLLGLQHKALT